MKKRLVLNLFVIILVLCTIFAFTACNKEDEVNHPDHSSALTPKVVLFIGDGMGVNHTYNTELYTGKQAYFSSFAITTMMETNSLSGTTDSAAAATAMATGHKVENSILALGVNNSPIASITELAKNDLYGTGVVTSDEITGATPSGFSAHAKSRNNSAEILLSQESATLDLLLGEGSYSSVYKERFEQKGWTWAESMNELNTEKKRFVATFDEVVPENGTSEKPTLTELASYAIDYMETNYPTGYFLMIEGAKIDKASHKNDVETMIKNHVDFDNAINLVDQKLASIGGGYSIIVTADHETGGLQRAESKDQITNDLYTTTDHTPVNVKLYFKSTLTTAPTILDSEVIPNTDVFRLCKQLLAIA